MADDDQARDKTAADWKAKYGWNLTRKDVNCDGCRTEGGRIFGYCNECAVRACASGRNLPTCAHCNDYVCEKLAAVIKFAPQVGARLEEIRRTLA
jgi:hypothetical protein